VLKWRRRQLVLLPHLYLLQIPEVGYFGRSGLMVKVKIKSCISATSARKKLEKGYEKPCRSDNLRL
jgi:hypothetical protein